MRFQGFLYDIARGQRGDVKYLETLIKRLKSYNYNLVILHLEYRFVFRSHPMIGPEGSLNSDDVTYLDKLSRKLGIELVPLVNCIGHNEGICLLERYKHLSVDSTGSTSAVEQFVTNHPDVLKLNEDLYTEVARCFSSKYLHIGADEVRQMEVQMPKLKESERVDRIIQHLLHVFDICEKLGKKPMMWGDMILAHKRILKYIPEDAIICDWHYENGSMETLKWFKKSNRHVLACPAVSSFKGWPVDAKKSTDNICIFTKEARQLGVDGVLLCNWEVDKGSSFTPLWPWIYLCSEIIAGKDKAKKSFLRAYSLKEYGIKNNALTEYHHILGELIPYQYSDLKLYLLFKNMMRTKNILALCWSERIRFNSNIRKQVRLLVKKAKKLANNMVNNACKGKNELKQLLDICKNYETILDIFDILDHGADNYRKAAYSQGKKIKTFIKAMKMACNDLNLIKIKLDVLKGWSEKLVNLENQACEERWWIPKAQREIDERIRALKKISFSGPGLIVFENFIKNDPDIPNRVPNR